MRHFSRISYQHLLVATVIAISSFPGAAQQTTPVQRQGSATVSAGISKEQLALEDRLNGIVSQGDQLLRRGNAADAVRQYEDAFKLVQNQPLLAEQRNRVMDKLASGYSVDNRAKDAISIRSELLEAHKKDCEAESTAASDCAEAQFKLGAARMAIGDFADALSSLQEAEASYVKAEKFSHTHEFTMIEVKDQAETEILSAVALFQLGRTAEAIASAETAILQLTKVQADDKILSGIRDDAARNLQQAQSLLSRFKSAQ